MHFANQGLFISIATLLWAANIHAKLDKNGDPMYPSVNAKIDQGLAMYVLVYISAVYSLHRLDWFIICTAVPPRFIAQLSLVSLRRTRFFKN